MLQKTEMRPLTNPPPAQIWIGAGRFWERHSLGKAAQRDQGSHPGMNTQFSVEGIDLIANGANTGAQLGGNFLGLHVAGEECHELVFPRGKDG